MIQEIELILLKEIPNLDIKIILEIEALAPLSMVNEIGGGYYKSDKFPKKKMLAGMLENLIGWNFDREIRKKIIDELKIIRKNQNLKFNENFENGSTFQPLISEYFEIITTYIPNCFHYDDFFKIFFNRKDELITHIAGTNNISWEIIYERQIIKEKLDKVKEKLKKKKKEKEEKKDKEEIEKLEIEVKNLTNEYKSFLIANIDKIPLYYSQISYREYIVYKEPMIFKLKIDKKLYEILNSHIEKNNSCYLGNSEGWVNLKIVKI